LKQRDDRCQCSPSNPTPRRPHALDSYWAFRLPSSGTANTRAHAQRLSLCPTATHTHTHTHTYRQRGLLPALLYVLKSRSSMHRHTHTSISHSANYQQHTRAIFRRQAPKAPGATQVFRPIQHDSLAQYLTTQHTQKHTHKCVTQMHTHTHTTLRPAVKVIVVEVSVARRYTYGFGIVVGVDITVLPHARCQTTVFQRVKPWTKIPSYLPVCLSTCLRVPANVPVGSSS
jgi:hypothetical protein